jgi:uncharacterized protein DUF4388/PEGA domain-containing protein
MKSSMQGKGVAAPDPNPSVNMANIARLSLLIADSDAQRAGDAARLLRELGLQRVAVVGGVSALLALLKTQAFDVLLCAEQLGEEESLVVLRAVRKLAPATLAVLMRPIDRTGGLLPEGVEAIELPLLRTSLERLLDGAASPHGGLWCEVPALSLTDILQMYHQARRSITVLLSGPIAGRIRLAAGEIVDAESNEERGMAALSRLLEAESGLLRTEAPRSDQPQSISAPFQSVLLEATQKLDERRRDSLIIASTASVSSAVLHPAATPSLRAHTPNPEAFIAPASRRRRRHAWVAALSVAASLAFAFGAASYLGMRIDARSGPRENPRGAASRESSSPQSEVRVVQSSQALAPPATPLPTPALPPGLPSHATEPQTATSSPPSPPAGPSPAAERHRSELAAPATADPRPVPPAKFELRITSKPSRATVTEAGKVLGKTPLTLAILESSVAAGPREFAVRLPGYLSGRVVQAASDSNVSSFVVLSPRPSAADVPDAGVLDPDGQAVETRSTLANGKRKDLGIRLRR